MNDQVPVRHTSLTFATYQTDQQSDKQSNKTKKTQRTKCEEECNLGTPCFQEMFEPIVISETEQLQRKTEIFSLSIIPPPYTIDFKYEIKTPMIHFLCYIASTVNLWLGASVLPLLLSSIKILFSMKGANLSKDRNKIRETNSNNLVNSITSTNYYLEDGVNKSLTNYGFKDNDRY